MDKFYDIGNEIVKENTQTLNGYRLIIINDIKNVHKILKPPESGGFNVNCSLYFITRPLVYAYQTPIW